MFFSKSEKFDRHKMQTALKMAVSRINMMKNKKENQVQTQRREIAELLRAGKEESARIKVEGAIRDAYLVEALEIMLLFIDLLSQRLQLIAESVICPPDMKEAVSTIIWAAPRVENIPELLTVRSQLGARFGKEFVATAQSNSEMAVNTKVFKKLSMLVAEPYFCVEYMKNICAQFQIDWSPTEDIVDATRAIQSIPQYLPDPPVSYPSPPPPHMMHPLPQYAPPPLLPSAEPSIIIPPPHAAAIAPPTVDFDDLERKFATLKRGQQ